MKMHGETIKIKYMLCQCTLRRMRTSVLFVGRFSDSFSNPCVRKCQLVQFLLMLETKGVRKGESLTFSVLTCARGTEVIYYIDFNRRHFRTDFLKRDLRFPQ